MWPDCWPAVRVFVGLRTQWHFRGMSGELSGLIYTEVRAAIDRLQLPRRDADDLFDDVQQLEWAALEAVRSKRS